MDEIFDRQPSELSRILKLAGFGLYILFACNLLSSMLPLRLIEPAWQMTSITALQNFAFLPLIGTCALLLAIDPEQSATDQGAMLIRRACGFACVGFLLLIPLQASAMWRMGVLAEIPAERMVGTIAAVRSEIASSQNLTELNTALVKLPGAPKLPPGFNQPLAKVRQSMLSKLGDDLAKLRASQNQRLAGRRVTEVLLFARTVIVDLVFAIFFGAVAGFTPPRLPTGLALANPFSPNSWENDNWERRSWAEPRGGRPGAAQLLLRAIRERLTTLQRRGDARRLAAKTEAAHRFPRR